MASARDIKDMSNYCDVIFGELSEMKARLLDLIDTIDHMQGRNKEMVSGASNHGTHDHVSHLKDIANTIDWKLEILTRVCPVNWMKYAAGAEIVSVKVPEKLEDLPLGDYGW